MTPRSAARPFTMLWVILSYLAVAATALVFRTLNLGSFVTFDEVSFWMTRSRVFLQAVQTGDYAATAITTHPGVTTMWLGATGIWLHGVLLAAGIVHDAAFPTRLALMQLPLALVHSAGVVLGYRLLRQIFRPAAALLATLLWATDPFIIAFSRVLHVDGLAMTFCTLSLLAACIYWHHTRRARWLIVSAICAGLAILSKSPSVALAPTVGIMALLTALQDQPLRAKDEDNRWAFVLRAWLPTLRPVVTWGVCCALTIFALWPALWVGPLRAYELLRIGVEVEGTAPHMGGNFFLGRENDVPGPLFYPVAIALRLTPWGLIGVLALPFVLGRKARAGRRTNNQPGGSLISLRSAFPAVPALSPQSRDLAALACFAVVFVVGLSLFAKQINRYVVPIFPALDTLAAVGLLGIAERGAQLRRWGTRNPAPIFRQVTCGLVAVLALANAAWYHPYGIVYFNQLLGGPQAGAQTFTIGWGEGMEQVADWLNQQSDITGVLTAATMMAQLQPYLRSGAQSISPWEKPLPEKTGYMVIYARHTQWGSLPPPFDAFYGRQVPLKVVNLHGVDYAWIYQVAPPVASPHPANFGTAIRLRGFDLAGPAHAGQALTLKLFWETGAAPAKRYTLFAHLIGADGRRYAQADLLYPTDTWEERRYYTTELVLPLAHDLPTGSYHLFIGLYDSQSNQRLALSGAEPGDTVLAGPDALLLTEVQVR